MCVQFMCVDVCVRINKLDPNWQYSIDFTSGRYFITYFRHVKMIGLIAYIRSDEIF